MRNKEDNKLKWDWEPAPISEGTVSNIEGMWKVVFPSSYKKTILKYNGCRPDPYVFDTRTESQKVFRNLISFSNSDPAKSDIIKIFQAVKSRLPQHVFPFAQDPFGNLICFNFGKKTGKEPSIVYWNHEIADPDEPGSLEEAISYICDTFAILLNSLYEVQDES